MTKVKELQEQVLAETRWTNFWKQHPTFRNTANRGLMEQYLADNMLSPASENGAEALEIAFLACSRSICENIQALTQRANERTAAQQAEADRLAAEQLEAERLANEEPNDTWSKERLNKYLETHDPRRLKAAQTKVLPAEYTPEGLQAMSSSELTRLAKIYSFQILNDRLAGKS
jgi:hypothetical protein